MKAGVKQNKRKEAQIMYIMLLKILSSKQIKNCEEMSSDVIQYVQVK